MESSTPSCIACATRKMVNRMFRSGKSGGAPENFSGMSYIRANSPEGAMYLLLCQFVEGKQVAAVNIPVEDFPGFVTLTLEIYRKLVDAIGAGDGDPAAEEGGSEEVEA